MRADLYAELERCLEEEELVALATVVDGPGAGRQMLVWPDGRTLGDLGSKELQRDVVELAGGLFPNRSGRETFGDADVFVEVLAPPPKLVIVGAVHVAIPLVTFANTLGFRTVVVDPRTAFANPERFPHADELIFEWPDEALPRIGLNESTYVAVLSHDLKLDLPAIEIALRSPARYIGALGSSRTHAKRIEPLKEKGFPDEEIARIHAPIGLDLGGRRAEEIALSVIAEVTAVRHGRSP